jgi:hypothetical protein
MKTYKLYVCMPIAKFSAEVKADDFRIKELRINFYKKNLNHYSPDILVASYPSKYTIIETITENK